MTRSAHEFTKAGAGRHAGTLVAALAAFAVLLPATPALGVAASDIADDRLSDEDRLCLACHEQGGLDKVLGDGTTLSLHVGGAAFADSVHAWVGCTGCHDVIDPATHPGHREIESARTHAEQHSQACIGCHAADSMAEGPAHHARLAETDRVPCAQCHDAHAIGPIGDWKAAVGDTAYCQACHGHAGSAALPFIDEATLRRSVHRDHECAWCHTTHSKDAHPQRAGAGGRTASIELAGACRQCHEDKYALYDGSIHARLVAAGDLTAPVCTDCHGAHAVGPKAVYETIAGVPCRNCHADIFDAYLGSMHGKARDGAGHFDAPICADCHRAHDIGVASTGTRLRDACLACHDGARESHRTWLPNAALHLEAIACPACHAPAARRRIDLALFDAESRNPLASAPGQETLEDRFRTADRDGDGVDAIELWSLVREINRDGAAVEAVLRGRMEVQSGVEAHRLADRSSAVRACESCHRDGADPFRSVTISIVRPDGRPLRFAADSEVLESPVSVGSVGGFYAIGGTRIRLLDALFVLALVAGIAVPFGHMAMRRLLGKRKSSGDGR